MSAKHVRKDLAKVVIRRHMKESTNYINQIINLKYLSLNKQL